MPNAYGDLEIALRPGASGTYAADLRFRYSDSETDKRNKREGTVALDLDRLRELTTDVAAYGHQLGQGLLQDPTIGETFADALTAAQARDIPLRLRLFLSADTPELQGLHWEALRHPQDGNLLFTGEQVFFSRYLSSSDWRPESLRAKGDLRALAVIANPSDLARYQLAPLDVPAEIARVHAGLAAIPITTLASGPASGAPPSSLAIADPPEAVTGDAATGEAGASDAPTPEADRPSVSGRATLRNVMEQLRAGHDILYLVCHGALVRGEPWLWLEDDAGVTARVAGADLAARLRDLPQRPRLVVLVSCHSAGSGAGVADAGVAVLSALGPRLAEAGVPAVLAMHGAFSLQTAARFMPVFFQELQRDGQIDRAVALARGSVREQPDAWMPVLFMRLRSGRIWYEPGFDAGQKEFEKWPALLRRISDGRCTPILGPGLLESLLGSPREIARRWADTFDFPMAEYDREDLPQVAQFLAIDQDYDFPRDELAKHLEDELKRRYGADLPAEMGDATLEQLLQAAGAQQRQRDAAEPHQVLAQLPVPIYISTNPDNLMAESLSAAGKHPEVVVCPWKDDVELLPSIYEREPDYLPEPSRPLVYHLFGHLREPDSVVLTEDDYFDYLIGVTSNRNLVPAAVRRALANTSLLFLGFDLTGWDFRVLFRSIVDQEGGRALRKRYAHVAAQIDPQQGRFLEPDRARQYLESYFQGAEISIYWGSAQAFVRELQRRWAQDGATPAGT